MKEAQVNQREQKYVHRVLVTAVIIILCFAVTIIFSVFSGFVLMQKMAYMAETPNQDPMIALGVVIFLLFAIGGPILCCKFIYFFHRRDLILRLFHGVQEKEQLIILGMYILFIWIGISVGVILTKIVWF